MKVGIITWHFFDNVGSNLQAYALQTAVERLGHDVKIIDYRPLHQDESAIKKFIKDCCVIVDSLFPGKLDEKLRFGSLAFRKKNMKCTRLVHSREELEVLSKEFDAIICGSDQIWAPNCFNDIYMLTFVGEDVRKISYAPSIGLNDLPEEFREIYSKHISRIDFLSAREDKGVEILENRCGLKATQVVDPTLLLERNDWKKVCEKETAPEGEYIFSYLLGDKKWIRERIKAFAEEKRLKLVVYSAYPEDQEYADVHFERMGSPKFVKCIEEAAYVLTDSFHGLLFATQFHKDVFVFDRYDEDEEKCQNSRIKSVLTLLGMENRRVSRDTVMVDKKIDYELVDQKKNEAREKSIQYLKTALKE